MMKVRAFRPLSSTFSIVVAITCSLLLLVTGCGSVHPGSTQPTVTITANPTSIAAGASSTLTVTAANASTVTVTGSDGSSKTLATTGGTMTVSPKTTTTYTATAGASSGSATATATVTVSAAAAPTVTISASPTSITAGGSSTLTVAATNASTVIVKGSDGSSYNLSASGGTQAVKPAATTTYTATATGATGTTPASATATVTVTAPAANPTVTVSANPTTVVQGTASSLAITATNAVSITVAGSDGYQATLPSAAGGNLSVTPSPATVPGTVTYTVTATGATGTTPATATATVNVTAPPPPPAAPTVTLTAAPTTINPGNTSTLTVAATNATSLTISGSDGSSFTQPALSVTGGTEPVTPTQTVTYTATATNATGTAQATVTVTVNQVEPTVTIAASPTSIAQGNSSTLTVVATNATSVTITGTDSSTYTLAAKGGTQAVSPTSTTTYTATADGAGGTTPATATATVSVVPAGSVKSINHVIFMLQENRTFDAYFGMLNPYRQSQGWDKGDDGNTYDIDGIEDKINGEAYDSVAKNGMVISNADKSQGVHTLFPLKSTCLDDMSSAWTESFGDVNLGSYLTTRSIKMNGYVSNSDGFANGACPGGVGPCTGYSDTTGDRSMGYYDQGFLNYYYYMASQFALSDRWFSPIETKTIPNRIATYTGGTTQGLTRDPGNDDHLSPLQINSIFSALDNAKVSWKVYYTVNNGSCDPEDCNKTEAGSALLPDTTFSFLTYYFRYVGGTPPCTAPKVPSSVVGDSTNSFCIDPTHVAPVKDPTYGYFADLKNGTLPSFAFIESGSGVNDEHPGYGQSVLQGQNYVSTLMNALMNSTSWKDSVFFFAFDEGGGPYDHVPPVPGHTNDFTDKSAAANYTTDVSTISVQPDSYYPCVPAAPGNPHCDLQAGQPGSNPGDAAGPPTNTPPGSGFGAQVGFRVPNFVVSPFARRHYVSHIPMDHTAIIRFVEDRFIGNGKYLTARDAAQPTLLDFFDFTGVPWATPPTQGATPPPTPTPVGSTCKPTAFH